MSGKQTGWLHRGLALCVTALMASCVGGPGDGLTLASVEGEVELLEAPLSLEPRRFRQAGVRVVLEGAYTNVSQTDEEGRYAFRGIPAGDYVVRASFGEFTREQEVVASLAVSPEAGLAPLLTLTTAGSISGRVTLAGRERGNTAVRVTLDGTDFVTTTDDEGYFVLARVPVGEYRVRAERADFGGRTLRGVAVRFAEVTDIGTLALTEGVFSDFNNPPTFAADTIAMRRWQPRPGSSLQPLPLDLDGGTVARFDTVTLQAPATDLDGDRLTYYWSVTSGVLDRTDAPEVAWTVSSDTGAAATITVRVVDERAGASFLSRQVDIADLQTMSAQLADGRLVYAYRRFSGTWRVLELGAQEALAAATLEPAPAVLGTLRSVDDPRPVRIGDHYAATPFDDGDRRHVLWRAGEVPARRTLPGVGRALPFAGRLVQAQPQSGRNVVVAYDPADASTVTLFDCGSASCGDLATTTGSQVVTILRDPEFAFASTLHAFDAATGALTVLPVTGGVGSRLRTDGLRIVHTDAPNGFGRSSRNTLIAQAIESGSPSQLYRGLYDVVLGAFDGRFIGFTEQEYRVVYSPEKAYLYDTQLNQKALVDDGDDYAIDEVLALATDPVSGERYVVVRRYPKADWLVDEQRTHFEVALRKLAP